MHEKIIKQRYYSVVPGDGKTVFERAISEQE